MKDCDALPSNTVGAGARPWGHYVVLDEGPYTTGPGVSEGAKFKIKNLVVNPNRCLSMQRHTQREEVWLVKEGSGTAIIGSEVYELSVGDVLHIQRDEWHQLINGTNEKLVIHEIQHGDLCDEMDIERK